MSGNPIRTPRQKRSIEKKERILTAAYSVFCKNGYYETNTSEIAAEAGVSVGCLYSYFSDKHAIFMETLSRYHEQFETMHLLFEERMNGPSETESWFREYMELLIKAHDDSLDFQREIKMLYYRDPDVKAHTDRQQEEIQQVALTYLRKADGLVHVEDIEAAAVVSSILISAVVDQISLCENKIDRERILSEAVKALCLYLGIK
jgi:Transcriptional regulator